MILAIDQGTTSTRCIVFDERAEPIGRAYREFRQHFPRPGWVEHDADEIWRASRARSPARRSPSGRRAAGELARDRHHQPARDDVRLGPRQRRPLHHAIVWQDRRTAARCAELRAQGHERLIRERTGLVLDPYFSATKLAWLLDHVDGLRDRARAGRARRSARSTRWLVWKLTGGAPRTDASQRVAHAAVRHRTRGDWDDELLDALRRARARCCREVVVQRGPIARHAAMRCSAHAVPIAGIAGDQQAALFGQACFDPGHGARTPTAPGCFMLMNTGARRRRRPQRAARRRSRGGSATARTYALEGASSSAGAAVQWLRDGLGIIADAAETEALARRRSTQRRRLLRAGLHRAGRAALGPVRARADRRPDARHHARAPRARGARGDRATRPPTRSPRWTPSRRRR